MENISRTVLNFDGPTTITGGAFGDAVLNFNGATTITGGAFGDAAQVGKINKPRISGAAPEAEDDTGTCIEGLEAKLAACRAEAQAQAQKAKRFKRENLQLKGQLQKISSRVDTAEEVWHLACCAWAALVVVILLPYSSKDEPIGHISGPCGLYMAGVFVRPRMNVSPVSYTK